MCEHEWSQAGEFGGSSAETRAMAPITLPISCVLIQPTAQPLLRFIPGSSHRPRSQSSPLEGRRVSRPESLVLQIEQAPR